MFRVQSGNRSSKDALGQHFKVLQISFGGNIVEHILLVLEIRVDMYLPLFFFIYLTF
jgi:hypothetical protein